MTINHAHSHLALPGDTVVLLHGFLMSRLVMFPLGRWLARQGFHVEYFAYPTATMPMAGVAQMLRQRLFSLRTARVHLIGHSLGGLVIRQLFRDYPQQRTGCVVTIGTPHQGSQSARRAVAQGWGAHLLRENKELLCSGMPDPWQAGNPHGVIAGCLPIGPLGLLYGIPRPHDGLISVAETRLEGTKHVILPVSHSGFLLSQQCFGQVGHFLLCADFATVAS